MQNYKQSTWKLRAFQIGVHFSTIVQYYRDAWYKCLSRMRL